MNELMLPLSSSLACHIQLHSRVDNDHSHRWQKSKCLLGQTWIVVSSQQGHRKGVHLYQRCGDTLHTSYQLVRRIGYNLSSLIHEWYVRYLGEIHLSRNGVCFSGRVWKEIRMVSILSRKYAAEIRSHVSPHTGAWKNRDCGNKLRS